MLIVSQRLSGRYRRITALAAVYALLLAGGLASQHTDGSPAGHHHRATYPGVPGLHSEDCSPSHHPDLCLACLWGRAAVGGPLSAKPSVARVLPAHAIRCPGENHYHSLLLATYSSRAPPVLSL